MSVRGRRRGMKSRQIPTTGTLGTGGARRTRLRRTSHAHALGDERAAAAVVSPKVRLIGIWQDRGVARAAASPKVRLLGIWQDRGVPRTVEAVTA